MVRSLGLIYLLGLVSLVCSLGIFSSTLVHFGMHPWYPLVSFDPLWYACSVHFGTLCYGEDLIVISIASVSLAT
ncbi:hypothetical protein BZA77DRAFT_316261 [Pyronema omphalodes]|nr:hypothetical protein BZA77DRAFT_316261 [Pyronema omphalodes]